MKVRSGPFRRQSWPRRALNCCVRLVHLAIPLFHFSGEVHVQRQEVSTAFGLAVSTAPEPFCANRRSPSAAGLKLEVSSPRMRTKLGEGAQTYVRLLQASNRGYRGSVTRLVLLGRLRYERSVFQSRLALLLRLRS